MVIGVPLSDLMVNLKNVMRVTESRSVRLTGHFACVRIWEIHFWSGSSNNEPWICVSLILT
jgi:hypothetical protein